MNKTVVHIYGSYPKKWGSIEEYYFALTEILKQEGFKSVFVFTKEPENSLLTKYNKMGASIVILPSTIKRVDIPVILKYAKLFWNLRPAIVNVVFGRIGFNSLLAARLAGIRGTVWTKGSLNESGPYYYNQSKIRIYASLTYLQGCLANNIITVSSALKKELLLYRIPDYKINHIYRGINLNRFMNIKPNIALMDEFNINKEDIVISCISQARHEKGHEYLIRAMPSVVSQFKSIRLLIVGGGPLTDNLINLSKQLNVQNHIRFCGVRNDIENIIAISKFTVLPSLTEGLCLALLESIAGGKPVVASNVGGNPEVIIDGQNGFLVPPRDENSISEKIIMLLSSPPLLKYMESACLEKAVKFDVKFGAQKTFDLYKSMIKQYC